MINGSVAYDPFIALDYPRSSRRLPVGVFSAALVFGLSALATAWTLNRAAVQVAAPQFARPPAVASAAAPRLDAMPAKALFDPGFAGGSAPFLPAPRILAALEAPPAPVVAAPVAQALPPAPMRLASAPDEAAPSPPARPAEAATPASAAPAVRPLALDGQGAPPTAPQRGDRFPEKLFGETKTSGPARSYASPEGGLFGGASGPSSRYDRWTAVYDLSAHTVYLPDGTRLEAHSGLGDRLDDPAHVNERNRGATPPHVYELASLSEPFHGVRALRLNPVGGGDIFGRDGLLAHTYMLGPRGDSNGCVAFRNYKAFLQAYETGEVKRLAVVARLD